MLLVIARTEPNFWGLIEDLGKQYVQSVFGHLNDQNVSAFQQGKLAAIVMINLVLLVLAAVALARSGAKIVKRLQSATEQIDTKVQAIATQLAKRKDLSKRALSAWMQRMQKEPKVALCRGYRN